MSNYRKFSGGQEGIGVTVADRSGHYDRFAKYIDDCEVGWVKVRYLRQLAGSGGGQNMPRRQEVPKDEMVV